MKRNCGHGHAESRRRVGADDARRSTRRKLLIAFGAGALAPLASFAQQPAGKVWRIGILSSVSQTIAQGAERYGAFIAGLRELGYVEGRNFTIEWRNAEGAYDRLPGLAGLQSLALPRTRSKHR